MEQQGASKKEVSLTITSNGDFTFSGQVSDYEVTAMLETWKDISSNKHRQLKTIDRYEQGKRFFGRFAGLFPLVALTLLGMVVVKQCSVVPQAPTYQEYHHAQ